MPDIDQANDRYNPPGMSADDFQEILFSDVELEDLFWLKSTRGNNPPYRKTGDNQAGNTHTRALHKMNPRRKVYQRS